MGAGEGAWGRGVGAEDVNVGVGVDAEVAAGEVLRMDPHFFFFTSLQVLIHHVILTCHVISCDHFCDPLSK